MLGSAVCSCITGGQRHNWCEGTFSSLVGLVDLLEAASKWATLLLPCPAPSYSFLWITCFRFIFTASHVNACFQPSLSRASWPLPLDVFFKWIYLVIVHVCVKNKKNLGIKQRVSKNSGKKNVSMWTNTAGLNLLRNVTFAKVLLSRLQWHARCLSD